MADLSGFYQPPFFTFTEKAVKLSAKNEQITIRGKIDVLVVQEQLWILAQIKSAARLGALIFHIAHVVHQGQHTVVGHIVVILSIDCFSIADGTVINSTQIHTLNGSSSRNTSCTTIQSNGRS
jgi:hypothetical protein